MTLSNLINSNIKEIKILSTNGIDENIAIVLDDDKVKVKQGKGKGKYEIRHAYYERNHQKLLENFHKYYHANGTIILLKKKQYNKQPHVK